MGESGLWFGSYEKIKNRTKNKIIEYDGSNFLYSNSYHFLKLLLLLSLLLLYILFLFLFIIIIILIVLVPNNDVRQHTISIQKIGNHYIQ